jgi:hypothetical protein
MLKRDPYGCDNNITEQVMKIKITLSGLGGELDQQVIDAEEGEKVSENIHQAMKCWQLAPGDTIVIADVPNQG